MRRFNLVLLGAVLGASGIAVAQGVWAGYFWGGLALLGMVGHFFARRFKSNSVALRLYSVAFCIALVVIALVFTILAATSEPDQRGGFIGPAIIFFAMAGGAIALVIALERKAT